MRFVFMPRRLQLGFFQRTLAGLLALFGVSQLSALEMMRLDLESMRLELCDSAPWGLASQLTITDCTINMV